MVGGIEHTQCTMCDGKYTLDHPFLAGRDPAPVCAPTKRLRDRPDGLRPLPTQSSYSITELVYPARNILEFSGAIVAPTIAIVRCAFRIPHHRVCRIDPDHVCILHHNVRPCSVCLEFVVLAVEH